jgi:hypothetical protein
MMRAAALAAMILLLTACTSVPDRVRDALDSASSATASASLALHALDDGKATAPFTDTVLGDALTELTGVETELTETGPIGDPADAATRTGALSLIRFGINAVLDAREAVAAGDDLDEVTDAVDDATDTLHQLAGES